MPRIHFSAFQILCLAVVAKLTNYNIVVYAIDIIKNNAKMSILTYKFMKKVLKAPFFSIKR